MTTPTPRRGRRQAGLLETIPGTDVPLGLENGVDDLEPGPLQGEEPEKLTVFDGDVIRGSITMAVILTEDSDRESYVNFQYGTRVQPGEDADDTYDRWMAMMVQGIYGEVQEAVAVAEALRRSWAEQGHVPGT